MAPATPSGWEESARAARQLAQMAIPLWAQNFAQVRHRAARARALGGGRARLGQEGTRVESSQAPAAVPKHVDSTAIACLGSKLAFDVSVALTSLSYQILLGLIAIAFVGHMNDPLALSQVVLATSLFNVTGAVGCGGSCPAAARAGPSWGKASGLRPPIPTPKGTVAADRWALQARDLQLGPMARQPCGPGCLSQMTRVGAGISLQRQRRSQRGEPRKLRGNRG
jgi:hypothetical protein